MTILRCKRWLVAGASSAIALSATAQGAASAVNLSLEDLMNVEVTSVSKKPQRLANVAAAVFVINAEDIKLSGANSLAEALRLAPGIDATRFSANRWSVSARGFADLFAEKLLVLVDGRNAFSPAFSGVSWQDFQFPIEDVERIEVIRGPAAAIWGPNGMNGVINVITKSAAGTQGGQAVLGAGPVEGSYARARWGGSNADSSLFYRFYGSIQNGLTQLAPPKLGGSGQDAYSQSAAGLRVDGYLSEGARWDFSADFFTTGSDGLAYMNRSSGTSIDQQTEKHRGTTLRGRYERPLSAGGNLQVQAAYAQTDTDIPYAMRDVRNTFDLDAQHRFRLTERQELVWGANFRTSSDSILPTSVMRMNIASRQLEYVGLFVQDEIRLTDPLRLSLGLRADRSPLSGWDSQPTARLAWNFQPNQTLWGALSQSSRSPSRADSGFNRNFAYTAGTPNTLVVLRSRDEQKSERLAATEVGLRSQWSSALSTDMVAFSHRYTDLLRTTGQSTVIAGFPLTVVNIEVLNGGAMTLNGFELTADWRINREWRAQLAQTWNSVSDISASVPYPSGTVPNSITSLRLSWLPGSRLTVDAWLRNTAARPGVPNRLQNARQAFTGLDVRVGLKFRKNMEFSLVGSNLNQGNCNALSVQATVTSTTDAIPSCQAASAVAQLRLDF